MTRTPANGWILRCAQNDRVAAQIDGGYRGRCPLAGGMGGVPPKVNFPERSRPLGCVARRAACAHDGVVPGAASAGTETSLTRRARRGRR